VTGSELEAGPSGGRAWGGAWRRSIRCDLSSEPGGDLRCSGRLLYLAWIGVSWSGNDEDPEEDMGILDGWSTEGIFSRGGGGGMAEGAGGEDLGATLGCRVSDGAWTMPGRPLC